MVFENNNKQIIFECYFNKNESNWKNVLKYTIDLFGFIPSSMSVYKSKDNYLDDEVFNENYIGSLLNSDDIPDLSVYPDIDLDLGNIRWFKFGFCDFNYYKIIWSNNNLDFLKDDFLQKLFKMPGFTVAYFYDNDDAYEQKKQFNQNKNSLRIDYPGQFIYTCGLQFIAASKIFFGSSFFEVIPKSKLLDFKYSTYFENDEIIEVKLFDRLNNQNNSLVRENQKLFWIFFNLDEVIKDFEIKNQIDASAALNLFLNKKNRKH